MRVFHQFSFIKEEQPELFHLVERNRLDYKQAGLSNTIITVVITEDHSAWPEFQAWTGKPELVYQYETGFSNEEILEADWVRVTQIFSYIYPEPSATWVTNPTNYGNFCRECGTYDQISPFRINREPKLRKNNFMSLEWTGGILFAQPNVINHLLEHEIRGFEVWPVILHRSGNRAEKIQQILITNKTAPGLIDWDSMDIEHCRSCGNIKYGYHRRGKMKYKRSCIPSGLDIILTNEWFGAGFGHFAFREILISNRFVRLVLEKGWKGFRMKVMELQ